ncbi:uncharacterized protein [Hyperolius riggenbachi]|uniref:uncharacterized protein n=1 Tax=Hyperolius riggenbachi TaxID=752182 RepID=UPI0035A3921F
MVRDSHVLMGLKEAPVKMVKKKWKSIRDRYSKDLRESRQSRSGQAPSTYKYHPLFAELSFLRSTMESRRTTTNVQRSEAQEEHEEEEGLSVPSANTSVRSSTETQDTEEDSLEDTGNNTQSTVATSCSGQRPRSPVVSTSRRNRSRNIRQPEANADVLAMIKTVESNVAQLIQPADSLGTFFRALEKEAREVPRDKWDELKQRLFNLVMNMKTSSVPPRESWATNVLQEPVPPYYATGGYSHMVPPQQSWYPYSQMPQTCNTQGQGMRQASSSSVTVASLERSTAEAVSASLQLQSRSSTPLIDDI